jgi:hypothetical protein
MLLCSRSDENRKNFDAFLPRQRFSEHATAKVTAKFAAFQLLCGWIRDRKLDFATFEESSRLFSRRAP